MIETRFITIEELNAPDLETRAETTTDGNHKVILYGALFNTQSRLITEKINGEVRTFYETIEPQAMNESDMSEVIYTIDHNPEKLLARKSAGNLTLRITERGLLGEATFNKDTLTTLQQDTIKNINQKNYRENSFAFRVAKDRWERKDGVLYRFIERISRIVDVSTVLMGAYRADTLFVRNFDESQIKEITDVKGTVYDDEYDYYVELNKTNK